MAGWRADWALLFWKVKMIFRLSNRSSKESLNQGVGADDGVLEACVDLVPGQEEEHALVS